MLGMEVQEMNFEIIRNKIDLAKILGEPQAILFLWVNWAVHAQNAQKHVEETVSRSQLASVIPIYLADVSNQEGEVWDALIEWLLLEGRPVGQLLVSGVGPLLWLRDGHVVLHVLSVNLYSAEKLAAVTESVFRDVLPAAWG